MARANSLPYGLAAYAFTSSTATANAIGDALEAGMVGVNSVAISTPETPFGGVKESGYGSEGGVEGLEAYMCKIHLAGLTFPAVGSFSAREYRAEGIRRAEAVKPACDRDA